MLVVAVDIRPSLALMSHEVALGILTESSRHNAETAPVSARVLTRERPVALYFGESGRPLSGFFHAALPTFESDAVVVLCKPIGWEAIASNRATRELAERLADGGVPVLRFDYLGTGDSSGNDADANRVEEWLLSIELAVAEAKRLSGKANVCLIGLHFGASLAMLAALRCEGVATLVLWAPYLTGRVYAREAKAYRALNDPGPGFPRAEDNGGLEAAGFLLSEPTLAALSALNLRNEKRAPAKRVLLLGRDTSGTEQPLVDHLQNLGVEVTHSVSAGYRDLMQDPLKSVLPEAELTTIATFVTREHVRPATAQPSTPPTWQLRQAECVETTPSGVRISERVLSFGPDERFFGILSEPEQDAPRSTRTLVMLLNTAPHTRVGPNRMYVPMARQLAARGFSSLRFDLRGVGDTLGSHGGDRSPIYSKAFVTDVQDAMTALEKLGFERFVAVGLCAGAYLAFHSALADSRLRGIVMVNAQTFDWKDGDSLEIRRRTSVMSNAFYKRAILQPETWKRALTGQIDFRTIGSAVLARTQHRARVEARRILSSLGVVSSTEWFDVAHSFEGLLKGGVQTYLVYSEEDEGVDHLQAHVGTRLKRLQKHKRFQLDLIKGADHTFSQIWAQGHLRDLIADHVARHFSEPSDGNPK